MIHTVRVTALEASDPLGRDVLAEIRRTLGLDEIVGVRTARVYRIEGVTEAEARRLAEVLLTNPVEDRWTLNAPLLDGAARVVEVAYRPGVMNPEAASILKAAADLGLVPEAVDASREYAFYGRDAGPDGVAQTTVEHVLARLLVNPTIEVVVETPPSTLRIQGTPGTTETILLRGMDDAALMHLARQGLYLDLDEMHAIRDYFDEQERDPTDVELEVLAQTWSEHCVHKTFRRALVVDGRPKASLMARLKAGSRANDHLVVSAFVDNSGVMRFYDGWAVCGKVETHNSPSAIEPYGGAMTGSGGVFRDILGTGAGADVIASTDIFCFAPPDLPAGEVPPGALPPDYLLRRVVAGVRDYGNRMGIPTNNGSVHFHPGFRAKPTVIVGAYGIVPEPLATKRTPEPGDRIIVMGGRTGRDGIHGATFSSTAMTSDTMAVNSQAVQIGNAVEEKRLLDAVLACRDAGLIRAITDCGAGGFSSAIGEMGEGLGATVELDCAPLKYAGLAPWEIFVSESQERMVLAVAPENVPAVAAVCATYNVEMADLGAFEPTGRLVVRFAGQVVGDLTMRFLHGGLPERTLEARTPPPPFVAPVPLAPAPADRAAWRAAALGVLAQPNVCSKAPIVRQYDHTVQGTAALGPLGGAGDGPNDAAVLAPLLGAPYGLVIAHGLHPALMALDPYEGALWAAAEAVSNLVAVGGNVRETSLIDNFIWPVPDPDALGALDRAVDACVDFMYAIGRPFISGKDSLSSTYRYPDGQVLHIPPVLCVSAFGRIPDVARTVGADLKRAGSTLVVVGARDAAPEALGGSAYLDHLGASGGRVPRVDLEALPAVLDAVHAAVRDGSALACHDVSDGGLFTALAEMAFGGGLGAEVDVAPLGVRPDAALFAETAGVFVVEVADAGAAEAAFAGVPYVLIGTTRAETVLCVKDRGEILIDAPLAELRAAWERPMAEVFHVGN